MQTNYHGHTKWCHHAVGTNEEVIVKAIEAGYEEIAITEHVPHLKIGKLSSVRVHNDEFDDFFMNLEEVISKYQDKIKILKGLECEYYENSLDWYAFLQKHYKIDYLILGHHYNEKEEKSYFFCENDEDVLNYQKEVLKALDTKMFAFFAHPDVYLNRYEMTEAGRETARAIFNKCQELKIPVEINANGVRHNKGYPNKEFWEISRDYDLTYIINADSHALDDLDDEAINKTYSFAHELGIKVTEKLEFN